MCVEVCVGVCVCVRRGMISMVACNLLSESPPHYRVMFLKGSRWSLNGVKEGEGVDLDVGLGW